MIRNYFLAAFRHFKKQKTASLINISGLSIGITCCALILLFVTDELKFDQFNEHKDRVCRLIRHDIKSGERNAVLPAVLFDKMIKNIPEFETGFRLVGNKKYEASVSSGDKRFMETVYFADNEIFNVLTLPLDRGNKLTALNDPDAIVITQQIAKKYFGNADPIGRILNYENKYNFKVTGILKEVPYHSHIRPSMLASIKALYTLEPYLMNETYASGAYFYFKLKKNTSDAAAFNKLNKIFKDDFLENPVSKSKFVSEPLSNIYLYGTNNSMDNAEHGDIILVKGFIAIALLIMLMAVFNFTNLLGSYVKIREKELVLRKLLGADKKAIFRQIIFETCFYLTISVLISFIFIEIFISHFNLVIGKQLIISSLFDRENLIIVVLFLLFIAVVSVTYPAIVALRPGSLPLLKQSGLNYTKSSYSYGFGFRHIVTSLQFIITIGLIAAIIVIYQQMIFIKSAGLGFNNEQLIIVENVYNEKMYDIYKNYMNSVIKYPEVVSASASSNVPGNNLNNYTQVQIKDESSKGEFHMAQVAVDYGLLKTWQTKLIDGRDFSEEHPDDVYQSVVINKAAAKILGLKNITGTELEKINNTGVPQKIIGITEDIHFMSFREKVEPCIMYLRPWSAQYIIIRAKSNDMHATIQNLEHEWKKVMPDRPFVCNFADDTYNKQYMSEERTEKLITLFCSLAVIISSIGLLALITIILQMRQKEIGIRKVLGASVPKLFLTYTKEYAVIVIISNCIALPLSYYFLNQWLERFVYRISVSFASFAAAGLIALMLGFCVIAYKVIKAARVNPVEILKYE